MEITPKLSVTEDKIRLLTVKTDMFKTACLTLNVLVPMGEYAAEYAVLSSYLVHSSKKYDSLIKLNSRLEELYGALLSGSISRHGENYRIQLSITCIDDSLTFDGKSVTGASLELLLSLLTKPSADENGFSPEQLSTEIRLTAEDIESEINDKRSYAMTRMLETMCADEIYGLTKNEILENVKKVTPQSLLAAWKFMLKNGIIQLNAIGNISEDDCKKKLREAFSDVGERTPYEPETVFVEEAEDLTELTEELTMNQSKLVLGFRGGMTDENDDFYSRRIMTDVFGGGPYSRLFMNVREKLSLCYYCSARLIRGKGIIVIQSGIEKENRQKVLDEINKQLDIMKNGEFSDEDFEASKKAICDAYRSFNDTPDALDIYYGTQLTGDIVTPDEAKKKIEEQIAELGIKEPQNLEEQALSLVGTDVYTKLIKGYTEKQWGRDCRDLPAFIIRRLPLRFTYNNNYFNDRWQGIPAGGYTALVEKLLEGTEVRLKTDYRSFVTAQPDSVVTAQTGEKAADGQKDFVSAEGEHFERVVYTGMLDEFFTGRLGTLEYRSLRFETRTMTDCDNYQGNAVVNYTERDIPYTRIIEHKHFEFGTQPGTVITKEYPQEWKPGDEPYYPVNDEKNMELFGDYKELADMCGGSVIFGGRLGQYKYYDMDKVIAEAIVTADAV